MLNFNFHNPTDIYFGENQIAIIAKKIPANARVLVVYGGGSIKKNGVFEQVVDALAAHTWFEFSGIEPNPKYTTLMQAQQVIKQHNIDYLLAVGGGSVIDGSKFIAAAALYKGEDPWHILSKQQAIGEALPLGAVLTLPATGSESNGNSVVTRNGIKLPFDLSVIDQLQFVPLIEAGQPISRVIKLTWRDRNTLNLKFTLGSELHKAAPTTTNL